MLSDYYLKISLLTYLSLLYRTHVNGLFFGALGGGGCSCGCCPSCCPPAITIPSITIGGCASSSPSGCTPSIQTSCTGSAPSYSGCSGSAQPSCGGQANFIPTGGGCSSGFNQQYQSQPRPLPHSTYAVPPVLPTFSPQLPQMAVFSVAPTGAETPSGGASPSYMPFIMPSNVPPSPQTSAASSYSETPDTHDNVEKPTIDNDITGIDSSDKVVKSTASPNDIYDDKMPDIEDYGDVTNNKSGKNGNKKNDLLMTDYSDDSFKSKVSGLPNDLMSAADQDTTGDPKCSSETLRIIMQENIVSSPTISKQLIFSAGRLAFGQTIDVICSRNKFSYTVVSSKIFCEASRGRITCFAFLQP